MNMYEIYIIKNNDWSLFGSSDDIKEIDKAVYKLTMLRPNKAIRILQDNIVLCFLDGSEYQYWYWKQRYVRNNKCDYIKSYQEWKLRKEKKK